MKTIISILLLISALCSVGAAQIYHIELCPTDDAYVDSDNPTTNYGGTSSLCVATTIWSSIPPEYERSYLKFDLSQIPVEPSITTTITSANLKLYSSVYGNSVSAGAYQCSNSWSEDTITWNSTSTTDSTPIDTVLVVHDDTWYTWNITESVQNSINDDISILLKITPERTEGGHESVSFCSKDRSSEELRPKLEITYTLSCSCSDTHINITDSDGDGVIDILDWDNSTPSEYWTDSHGRGRMWGDMNGMVNSHPQMPS
uniref:Carbohydrate-binding module family 96 domain-containing protein n=1 Tax=uncultured Methanosarcinales archaeon TaxID=183757 RepID=A0A7H1KNG2_9EURY|nr:hypothetical protein EKMJPAOO_00026 [uncultured Methanosarcinales archaeon]